MKQFLTVLGFELNNYFKNKGYIITTVLISVVLMIGLSLPSFFDFSKLIPQLGNGTTVEDSANTSEENITNLAIYDKAGLFPDTEILKATFPNSNWEVVKSEDEITELINSDKVKAGFVVTTPTQYNYLVKNSGFTDMNQMQFESLLSNLNLQNYAAKEGLDFNELNSTIHTPIQSEVTILGKDGVSNYIYTYMLVFLLYMMILIYGQLIAVAVTAEKSNRAIEVLVTSTSSNSLIFGKVIGGAIASFIQVGLILGSGIISYSLNRGAWNGVLDGVFNIPSNLLITFALFGGMGYLFYAFIFGALGALVSKTEDVSSSIGPIAMIFVFVFFISIFGMTNSDSMLMKVASFVPFSSFMTMLVRVAMGTVSTIEVAVSFLILVASTGLVALAGAKIYRLATLMYGNPIKLKNAFKWFKKEKTS